MQDEDEWEDDGEVNVDFLFFDPSDKQRSSVKLLINGFLDGLSFRSSELAEIICNQVSFIFMNIALSWNYGWRR